MKSGRLRAGIVIALIIVCSALAGAAIERVRMRAIARPGDSEGQAAPADSRASRMPAAAKKCSIA